MTDFHLKLCTVMDLCNDTDRHQLFTYEDIKLIKTNKLDCN